MENIKKENKILNKSKMKNNIKILLVGLITGILSGLFASGGGLVLVPAFVYIFKLTEKQARAMSVFCILPMCITSAIMYNRTNYIDWKLGILCGIGGIIGGLIGAKLLKKINDKYLILIFIAFLIYASVSMLRMWIKLW